MLRKIKTYFNSGTQAKAKKVEAKEISSSSVAGTLNNQTESSSENQVCEKMQTFFEDALPSQDIMKLIVDYSIDLDTSWFDFQDTLYWLYKRKIVNELAIFNHLSKELLRLDDSSEPKQNVACALNEFEEDDKAALFKAWEKAKKQGRITENDFILTYCFFEHVHQWEKDFDTKMRKKIANVDLEEAKRDDDYSSFLFDGKSKWRDNKLPNALRMIYFRCLNQAGDHHVAKNLFLSSSNLNYSNLSLSNWSFRNYLSFQDTTDLTGSNFKNAYLEKVDFSYGIFRRADFRGVKMKEPELMGADFRDARMDMELKMQLVNYVQEYKNNNEDVFSPLMKYLKKQVPKNKAEVTKEWIKNNPFILKQIIYVFPIMNFSFRCQDTITVNWNKLRKEFDPSRQLITAFKDSLKKVKLEHERIQRNLLCEVR